MFRSKNSKNPGRIDLVFSIHLSHIMSNLIAKAQDGCGGAAVPLKAEG